MNIRERKLRQKKIHAAHFFINNRNTNAISAAKHCFVVLNTKLLGKVRFKTFYRLLELLYTAFDFKASTKTAYPRNKSVIYQGVYQKITIRTVRPKLGKQALARPNVAGESEGHSEPPFSQRSL